MFLTGPELSEAIRRVVGGRALRCAVAFWGSGAAKYIRDAGGNVVDARILCDISMGGCWPQALEELGAPQNERLRRWDGLHAKVYISDAGAVVGSPNASANGIGFDERAPLLLEAGTFHEPASETWRQAGTWFDALYSDAKAVDCAALIEACERWQPRRGQHMSSVRKGSLLDLVHADPDQFGTLGFVFVSEVPTPKEREAARRALKKQAGVPENAVDALPNHGLFTGWKTAELRRWPILFVEFWISPGGRVHVFGYQTRYHEPITRSVFAKRNWAAIRSQCPASAPKADSIARADAEIATRLYDNSGGGVLYSSATALSKALIGL